MLPIFFSASKDFRKWFKKNHLEKKELLVGFYKIGSGKKSITWSESVDEALCFGWIDGIRKSIDEESYCIRFTPRKPKSIWSAVNIKKVEELTKAGLMQTAGLSIFLKREESKSRIYSFESEAKILEVAYEKKFRQHKKAYAFFIAHAAGYKKLAIHRIMSAKQESTRVSRLEKLISDCEKGLKIR